MHSHNAMTMAEGGREAARVLLPYRFEPEGELQDEPENTSNVEEGEDEAERELDGGRVGSLWWCECGKCGVMSRPVDCLCCMENVPAVEKKDPHRCVTELPSFEIVCLHKEVLDVALTGYFERNGQGERSNRFVPILCSVLSCV